MRYFFPGRKTVILFIIKAMIPLTVFSQNMNNPYSIYGIGDIDNKAYNRTGGMAGTGLAIKSSFYFVDNNPAAIAGLPRSFYTAHIAVTGRTSTFKGDPITADNNQGNDMWIKKFALAVKLNKFWASSIGFNQFSNINYKLSGSRFIEGSTSSYQAYYEGDGGLNEYQWTNAFELGKHFSIGIRSSFIAGSINQVETLADNDLQSVIVDSLQQYMANFRFQGGFIYSGALNKKWELSVGGKYSPKIRLPSEKTLDISGNGLSIVHDSYLTSSAFYLPQTFAGGFALKRNQKTTFAADYTYEDWSSLRMKASNWQLTSSNRVSAGVEFSKIVTQTGQAVEKSFFQLGGYYTNSYLQVRNAPIREYGFTAGMGGVLSKSLLYSVSLEGGVRGTTAAGLIRETYLGLTLTLSYRDFLFSKGRKYD